MDIWTDESEAAFDAYVESLTEVIGHADRAEPLKDYCLGLLMPLERKSVEPLAAVTAPARADGLDVVLALHFFGNHRWCDENADAGLAEGFHQGVVIEFAYDAWLHLPFSKPAHEPPRLG